jgi:hypothetical protein
VPILYISTFIIEKIRVKPFEALSIVGSKVLTVKLVVGKHEWITALLKLILEGEIGLDECILLFLVQIIDLAIIFSFAAGFKKW